MLPSRFRPLFLFSANQIGKKLLTRNSISITNAITNTITNTISTAQYFRDSKYLNETASLIYA